MTLVRTEVSSATAAPRLPESETLAPTSQSFWDILDRRLQGFRGLARAGYERSYVFGSSEVTIVNVAQPTWQLPTAYIVNVAHPTPTAYIANVLPTWQL